MAATRGCGDGVACSAGGAATRRRPAATGPAGVGVAWERVAKDRRSIYRLCIDGYGINFDMEEGDPV